MDKLRILLGNNTLSLLAGSETWVLTLAKELKRLGHTVHGFSPELGIISNKLKDDGIFCFDNISNSGVKPFSFILKEDIITDYYDIIIANHWNIVEYLRSRFPITPIISTIHGILYKVKDQKGIEVNAPEHPALNSGVNQFISVSEEVSELLRKEYNIDSIIIRNFLDCTAKFRKISPKRPKSILFNSNYNLLTDPEVSILKQVADHYGAKTLLVGQNFSITSNIEKAIDEADIVVGMGRSVLEGVAAGRLGIVHGRWGTGGVVCPENIEELKRYNFSGRNAKGKLMTAEEMINEIDKYYNKENIDWGIKYTKINHNVSIAATNFLNIAMDLLGKNIKKSEDPILRPYRRSKDVKPTTDN